MFLDKIKRFFAKNPQKMPPEVKKIDVPLPFYGDDLGAKFDEMIARNIQRTATQDIVEKPVMDEKNAAMDGFLPGYSILQQQAVPNSLLNWYNTQGFIGYQMCAILAQHWLILKCCNQPAKDAIRNGYEITVNDGSKISAEILDDMKKADIRYRIPSVMEEFVTKGRIFGVRIAMFLVDSPDPDYYVKPFNPDGVMPGSYRGITQIDPYWITPELDLEAGSDPASMFFYEPTWWRVNAKRIHRTHLIIFRNGEVADLLRPSYLYGGIPVPQQIYEKVYNAERTANEAPMLALTKRSLVMKTDMTSFLANEQVGIQKLQQFAALMTNYGVRLVDLEDEFSQFDTSLADLDSVIMTQYQLVAAAAKIPGTKLLGTAPKGFNATGEFDESSYHEELESIQNNDLTALLERHHLLLIRSEIAPKYNIPIFASSINWEPLDSPTAIEVEQINKLKADTDAVLATTGAIDGFDIRKRLINDRKSGHNGLEEISELGGDPMSSPSDLEKYTQYDPVDLFKSNSVEENPLEP